MAEYHEMSDRRKTAALGAGLKEYWLGTRNRLLASSRFQRWAARFPLTRPIAQRRARGLFDLVAGFVYSQVLFACIRLRLFSILTDGPLDVLNLAIRLDLAQSVTERLLRAAETLNLVERLPGNRYALGAQGAALIGNPGISAMVEHHSLLYADLADPVALLRGECRQSALARYWAYAGSDHRSDLTEQDIAAYTALMSDSQALVAGDVLDAYSLHRHKCLLDVGGGDGAFTSAAAARWPHLRLLLMDLPPVASRARARFEREGLSGRAEAFGGDLMSDPLPQGADIVSLVRVVHDHDDKAALRILGAVHEALPSQGTLLLAEPMSGTRGAEPIGDAYFGFYLLAMGSGQPRTPREIERLLRETGFAGMRVLRTHRPLLTRLIIARKS